MREKKCLESTVDKYINFLIAVKANENDKYASMDYLIEQHKINKSVRKTLITLFIIDYKSNNFWHYLSFEPDRKLALTVLDHLLEKGKKSRHTPIAGMEAFVTAVERNTEAINRNAIEVNKLLKTRENRLGDNTGDLFRVDSDRLYIAGQMVSLFRDAFEYNQVGDEQAISRTSDFIIRATDTLLLKLKAK